MPRSRPKRLGPGAADTAAEAAAAAQAGQGRSRDRHGVRVPRAAGARWAASTRARRAARAGLEGDLLPVPAGRRRGRRAAVARSSAPPRSRWAAVSLADKLDTLVGLVLGGREGDRIADPFGLRRQAQGSLNPGGPPELTGMPGPIVRLHGRSLIDRALAGYGQETRGGQRLVDAAGRSSPNVAGLMLERRGARSRGECAIVPPETSRRSDPLEARLRLERSQARNQNTFRKLAELFKRVKNISEEASSGWTSLDIDRQSLGEPAERPLLVHSGRSSTCDGDAIEARVCRTFMRFPDLQPDVTSSSTRSWSWRTTRPSRERCS